MVGTGAGSTSTGGGPPRGSADRVLNGSPSSSIAASLPPTPVDRTSTARVERPVTFGRSARKLLATSQDWRGWPTRRAGGRSLRSVTSARRCYPNVDRAKRGKAAHPARSPHELRSGRICGSVRITPGLGTGDRTTLARPGVPRRRPAESSSDEHPDAGLSLFALDGRVRQGCSRWSWSRRLNGDDWRRST